MSLHLISPTSSTINFECVHPRIAMRYHLAIFKTFLFILQQYYYKCINYEVENLSFGYHCFAQQCLSNFLNQPKQFSCFLLVDRFMSKQYLFVLKKVDLYFVWLLFTKYYFLFVVNLIKFKHFETDGFLASVFDLVN